MYLCFCEGYHSKAFWITKLIVCVSLYSSLWLLINRDRHCVYLLFSLISLLLFMMALLSTFSTRFCVDFFGEKNPPFFTRLCTNSFFTSDLFYFYFVIIFCSLSNHESINSSIIITPILPVWLLLSVWRLSSYFLLILFYQIYTQVFSRQSHTLKISEVQAILKYILVSRSSDPQEHWRRLLFVFWHSQRYQFPSWSSPYFHFARWSISFS